MFSCVEFPHGLVLSIVLILGLGFPLGHGLVLSIVLILGLGFPLGHGLVLSFVLGLGHPHGFELPFGIE